MIYMLKIKDKSGRDYSNVLSFKTQEKRESEMRDFAADEDLSQFEIDDIIFHLDNGDTVNVGACEYEYMVQYEVDEND